MRVLAERPDWFDDAACRGMAASLGGVERDRLFFPTVGQPTRHGKAICDDCPVRQQCADYAVDATSFLDGTWGGLSKSERGDLRRRHRAEAVAS